MQNKTIYYFNLIKALSIFLVIYVHYPWISQSRGSNLTMLMTIIAVPLFFMVNGALLISKEFNIKKHINKLTKLIFATIAWKILITIVWSLIGQVNIQDYTITEILLSLFTNYRLGNVPTEHLWFMYSLFKIYIIFPFIKIFLDNGDNKKYLKSILIFLFIFSFGIEFINTFIKIINTKFELTFLNNVNFEMFNNAYNPTTDTNLLFYFLFGYYLYYKHPEKKKYSFKNYILITLYYVIGLSSVLIVRYFQCGSLLDGNYERVVNDYCKIGTFFMSYSVFILCSKVTIKNKIIDYLGSKTFNIYFIHMLLVSLLLTYIYPIIKVSGAKINIIRTLIALLISIILTELLKRIPIINKILNIK